MKQIDTDLITAAGILEGEGYFGTKTNGYAPVVQCQMTDHDVLLHLAMTFGGTIISTKKQAEHHKDTWRWAVTGPVAAECMERIFPYMFERRKTKIAKCLATWNNRPEAEFDKRAMQAAEEYFLGGRTMRSLAEKYNVSRMAVQRRVARGAVQFL